MSFWESLRRWWRRDKPPRGPLTQSEPGDWVVMPYRIAEACRLSMCTVAQHPEMPDKLKWWIGQWLAGYNGALTMWFEQNYGPDIFPVLQQITNDVRAKSEEAYTAEYDRAIREAFERWEEEFKDDGEQ